MLLLDSFCKRYFMSFFKGEHCNGWNFSDWSW